MPHNKKASQNVMAMQLLTHHLKGPNKFPTHYYNVPSTASMDW